MADEKLNTGPAENISPEAAEPITTPEQAAASEPQQEQTEPAIPEPGDVVVSFDKINELMAEKRQNARAEVEKAETPETPEAAAPGETPQPANTEEPKKPRRGRPPKAEKAATENQKAEKSAGARKGRPPKADKAAPDKPKPSKRDKVSRSDGKAPDAKEPIKPAQDTAPKETATAEQTAPEPTTPPRPVEEGKLVYLKLSEVHPFHTFRPHPFKVRDDAKMQEIVASIRVNGVMVPGLARPEKDGNGYEIVAGHRRTHGSELAGLEEMPFIVREMTDHEAVQAMKDSNKQRDGMLPSELAALLELEVEDIKHQGGRLKGVAEGDVGKRSVEIVGEAHEMNYKKVMRYLRLNSLVPELLDKVDDKKMGFMPAVELSYIKPKNQRLIAVSIDVEQASPSLAQAKRLRELDKEGKAIYDKHAETILGNMDSVVFLGGREASTIKEISENWLGKATISMQTDSRSRGQSESYSQNTQRLGRELMTPAELATMPGDKCILQLRGLPPFFSPKYDLKRHPNYRYTAEADKQKNAFDLDRLINRRRRPGLNEACTMYEVTVPDDALTEEDEDILNYDDIDDPDAFA